MSANASERGSWSDFYRATGPVAVPLILASQSPRRASLLREAGYSFVVIPPDEDTEERDSIGREACDLVRYLARRKAENVQTKLKNRFGGHLVSPQIILGCDSVAVCQGTILGKPKDRKDAERMLRTLSGTRHEVVTGVCLLPVDGRSGSLFLERSVLRMDSLSEERISSYLASGLWRGKAGAFGWQDGNDWLQLEEGSGSNVVGLPLERLCRELARFRI